MEFNKNRVYTSLNADELRAGDKVIVANSVRYLKRQVAEDDVVSEIVSILSDDNQNRFVISSSRSFSLAYLVERKENCTNCGKHEDCGFVQNQSRFANLNRCDNYTPKTEQKEMCLNCKHYNKVNDFRDTDELVKVWVEKTKPYRADTRIPPLIMPLIWVQEKGCEKSADLITCYGSKGITVRGKGMYFDTLFTMFEFLDGSPCGVEE